MGLGLSVAIDLIIALTLMFFLQKGKTGFKEYVPKSFTNYTCVVLIASFLLPRTDNVIHKMIAFSVNSGLLTA